jgi:hypothetical protein
VSRRPFSNNSHHVELGILTAKFSQGELSAYDFAYACFSVGTEVGERWGEDLADYRNCVASILQTLLSAGGNSFTTYSMRKFLNIPETHDEMNQLMKQAIYFADQIQDLRKDDTDTLTSKPKEDA